MCLPSKMPFIFLFKKGLAYTVVTLKHTVKTLLFFFSFSFSVSLYNALKRIEVCIILYPLHVFYLTSWPLENSLDRPFSVIQFVSVAFSILYWNSPVHPSPCLSLHPSHMPPPCWRTHYADQLSHCLSYHSPLEYSLLSVCLSLLCFSHSLFLHILISI